MLNDKIVRLTNHSSDANAAAEFNVGVLQSLDW